MGQIKFVDFVFKFLKKFKIPILLIGIFVSFLISDVVWISNDSIRSHWDMGRHLLTSIQYYHDFFRPNYFYNVSTPNYVKNFYYLWSTPYRFYPPFVYVISSLLYIAFHNSSSAIAIYSLNLFALILIISSYLLARLYLSKGSSLLVSVYMVTIPIVFTQLHEYMIDIPQLAMFVLTLYFLIKANCFKSRKYSVLFAIAFALGMMTKWTFLFFILPPLIITIFNLLKDFRSIIKDKALLKEILFNLFLIVLIILLIDSPWYFNNISVLKNQLLLDSEVGGKENLKPGLQWLTYYLFTMENQHLYLIYSLIAFAGFIYVHLIKKDHKKYFMILFSFLLSYAFFTKLGNKDTRYDISLLIYAGIYAGACFEFIKSKYKYIIFVVIAVLQIYFVSFYKTDKTIVYDIKIPSLWPITIITNYGFTSGPPSEDNWPNEKVISDIYSYYTKIKSSNKYVYIDNTAKYDKTFTITSEKTSDRIIYFVGDNKMYFNTWDFNYYINKKTSEISISDSYTKTIKSGYLILNYNNPMQSKDIIDNLPSNAIKISQYTLPDSSIVYVYYLGNSNEDLKENQCVNIENQKYECRVE